MQCLVTSAPAASPVAFGLPEMAPLLMSATVAFVTAGRMVASRPPHSAYMSGLSASVLSTTFCTSPSAATAPGADSASTDAAQAAASKYRNFI